MAVDLGDVYRLTFDNTSPGGDLVSADTMTLTITLPDGTAAAPITATPTTPGRYAVDYLTTQPGRHLARWLGTGANPGAYAEAFDVRPPNPAYLISIADAKQHLNIDPAVTDSDDELRIYVEAATWAIEDYLRRTVVRRQVTETVRLKRPTYGFALSHDPVVGLTSITPLLGGPALDVDGFDFDEYGIVTSLSTILCGIYRVAYVAGMAVVPGNYLLAARIIVGHLWETQRGNRGAARLGGGDVAMTYTPSGFALPNRAMQLLGGRPPLVG